MSLIVPEVVIARYWNRVIIPGGDGCWGWQGKPMSTGYGILRWGYYAENYVLIHRLAYALKNGGIEDNIYVLHRCDNPICTNPDHLFLGTKGDNNRDRSEKGRSALGEACGSSKLTEAQVVWIKGELAKGVRVSEIARAVGFPYPTISAIKHGKSWKWL